MSVITVSRQLASLGSETAARVAKTLGFRLVDQEIIHRAAEEAGVPKIALQELAYEGRRDLADRVLHAVYAMPPLPGTTEPSGGKLHHRWAVHLEGSSPPLYHPLP